MKQKTLKPNCERGGGYVIVYETGADPDDQFIVMG